MISSFLAYNSLRRSLPRSSRSSIDRSIHACTLKQSISSNSLSNSKSVCIVGGGFAGLYTALKLENLARAQGQNLQVTLIDRKEKFVFSPLLYELTIGAATLSEVAPLYRDLLSKSKVRTPVWPTSTVLAHVLLY